MGRWEHEVKQRMHREKVKAMTSGINTKAPSSQPHLTLYGRDYVTKKRQTTEAAFGDLKMIQAIAKTMTRDCYIAERKGPVSLNADTRRREIDRIHKENLKMLDRLEAQKPTYVTEKALQAHASRQRYTVNCSHTMRRCGEYDDALRRFQAEDKRKADNTRRHVEQRRFERTGELGASGEFSVSMPDLRPPGGIQGFAGGGVGAAQVRAKGEDVWAPHQHMAPPGQDHFVPHLATAQDKAQGTWAGDVSAMGGVMAPSAAWWKGASSTESSKDTAPNAGS